MPTHLYCLLAASSDAAPPGAVRALDAGGVIAWAASTEAAALSRDAREIARATVEHDKVVNAALAAGETPVPVSLADPYPDDEAALKDVRENSAAIVRALERVRGLVEMTVIIAVQDSSPPAEAPGRGRAYLEQLRGKPSRAGDIGERVAEALRPLAGEPRRRGEGGTLALSHLVTRDAVERYRALTLALAGEGYRIVIDGPRAPYSFARFSPRRGILSEGAAPAA